MQAHNTRTTSNPTGMGTNQPDPQSAVLTRWVASEKKYVVARFNWSDPLDVAIAIALAGFRPGIDEYDA